MSNCTSLAGRAARLIILCCTWLLSSCTQHADGPLKIGINIWPGYEFLYLAEVKKFYRDVGVDVKLVSFNSLPDALHAYQRGQLDGVAGSIIELLMARADSSRDTLAAFIPDYSNGADVILATAAIQSVSDLKGKRIGLETGSLGIFMLARALDKADLTLSDVEMIPSDQLSLELMLQKGEVDAIVTYPPVSVRLASNATIKQIFSSSDIPGEVIDVLMFDKRVLTERLDDVKKVVKAFRKAQDFLATNPQEAYEIMAAREGISAAEFKDALTQGLTLPSLQEQTQLLAVNGSLHRALVRANAVLLATGQISRDARPDTAFTTAALQ